jgi:ligand-binding sensor domain-containing protein
MNPIIKLCLAAAFFTAAGCKKDNVVNNTPTPVDHETYPEWINYNTSNSKLPNNQINAIAVDKNGTKWIGTANGLACLKGAEWTIYNTANSGLPSSIIQAVATEDDGTVWIGTDKGLAKFNGSNWLLYNTTNSVLTDARIKCIVHDHKHHTTWIGTEEGFVKVDYTNHWEHIYAGNVILSMAVDDNGDLWLGEFNDFAFIGMIKKYENGKFTTHRLDQLGYTSALPYSLSIDRNNNVVALLAGTVVKSVIRFNGNNWQEITRPEGARGLRALAIEEDRIWVGGATFSLFGDKNSPLITMPGTTSPILSMAIDKQGRKWLGTYDDGLAVYNSIGK